MKKDFIYADRCLLNLQEQVGELKRIINIALNENSIADISVVPQEIVKTKNKKNKKKKRRKDV